LTIIVETNNKILTKEKNLQQNLFLIRFGVGALLGSKHFEKVVFSCLFDMVLVALLARIETRMVVVKVTTPRLPWPLSLAP
jgi:hypothetical protein